MPKAKRVLDRVATMSVGSDADAHQYILVTFRRKNT